MPNRSKVKESNTEDH